MIETPHRFRFMCRSATGGGRGNRPGNGDANVKYSVNPLYRLLRYMQTILSAVSNVRAFLKVISAVFGRQSKDFRPN